MNILKHLTHWFEAGSPADAAMAALADRAVSLAAPQVKILGHYQGLLQPAVEHAARYCADLVSAIPGPREITPQRFASDPLIHALFASSDDIRQMLGRSEDLRHFLDAEDNRDSNVFYGLLGMRAHEKSVLGTALQGEIIRQEVPQRLLYFTDHTVSSLGAHPEDVRRRLEQAAFDSLLHQYSDQMAALRLEREKLGGALGFKRGTLAGREIEERMAELTEALSPEAQVKALARWLASPESVLRLKETPRKVDALGVIAADRASEATGEILRFPELLGRDRRIWTVLLVAIPRESALEAARQEANAHRYIVI